MDNFRNRRVLRILVLTLVLALVVLCVPAHADSTAYNIPYNPSAAIAYAKQYSENVNPQYDLIYVEDEEDGFAREEDCTHFISQCLKAGGLPETEAWNSKSLCWFKKMVPTAAGKMVWVRKKETNEGFKTFVNAGKLNHYLASLGYRVEKNIELSGNTISIKSLHPEPGDVIQYDFEGDGIIDHSILYCGVADGEPRYCAHTPSAPMEPMSKLDQLIRPAVAMYGRIYGTVTYLIHMTEPSQAKANVPDQPSVQPDTTVPSTAQPGTGRVDQLYCGSGYNEGIYTGEFRDGKPNGWGKLVYEDRNGDKLFYTLNFGTQSYNAKFYEGNFKDGFRSGQGTVVFEGGYRITGTFYGVWEAGKTVFEGTLFFPNGYSWNCRSVCDSNGNAGWYSR